MDLDTFPMPAVYAKTVDGPGSLHFMVAFDNSVLNHPGFLTDRA